MRSSGVFTAVRPAKEASQIRNSVVIAVTAPLQVPVRSSTKMPLYIFFIVMSFENSDSFKNGSKQNSEQ